MKRSEVVRKNLLKADTTTMSGFLQIGRLISEARRKRYFLDWGYKSIKTWAEENLKIGYVSACQFARVSEGAKILKISDQELLRVTQSNLVAVFRLNPAKNESQIRSLLSLARNSDYETMANKVRSITGIDQHVKMTFCRISLKDRRIIEMALAAVGGDFSRTEKLVHICSKFLMSSRKAA